MENNVLSILEQFPRLKVLVAGEALLDSSVRGNAGRLALEAPVPVVDVHTRFERPGGAANVAVNAARLGASVELVSVIGQDLEGDTLVDILRGEGVAADRVNRSGLRSTLLKRRVYAESQLVVRYDQGSSHPIDRESEDLLLSALEGLCPQVDLVILSDYGHGVLTRNVLHRLAALQKKRPCILVADTRRLEDYRGLPLAAIRPSYPSALEMLEGDTGGGDLLRKLGEAGERILRRLDTQMVTITLDDNGALVLDRDTPIYRTYAARMPFNRVFGAGDAFICGLALSLAAGAQAPAAGEVASAVASIVVENQGQAACCIDELRAYLGGDHKLVEDWSSLETRLESLRRMGKRIVFTNGVFDILHSAHVAYLSQARSFGDILVVGVNADESVRRLKGPTRPVNHLLERCRVLAGLSCVDLVAPFAENDPTGLIHHVRPDVYVKGGDYTRETLPEAGVVESYGGELRLVEYIADHSTTGVIERIRGMTGGLS